MAKRRSMSKKESSDAWNALPESDRRFFDAFIILLKAIGDDKLRYREVPMPLQRTLHKLDRNTVFSVIAECLYLLLDAPLLERVKQGHRERAAKNKRRTKKSTGERGISRKGRSK